MSEGNKIVSNTQRYKIYTETVKRRQVEEKNLFKLL